MVQDRTEAARTHSECHQESAPRCEPQERRIPSRAQVADTNEPAEPEAKKPKTRTRRDTSKKITSKVDEASCAPLVTRLCPASPLL